MTVLYPPVVQVPVSVLEERWSIPRAAGKNSKRRLMKPWLPWKKAAPRQKGVTVETIVLQGVPTVMITDYIRFNDVTLLAIATHGHSGFRELTLGSTAEYLIHNAGIPIMLVTPRKRGKGVK